MARRDSSGRSSRRALRVVRDRPFDHLRRHAPGQHRSWRLPGSRRLSRAVAGHADEPQSVPRDPAGGGADVLPGLFPAARTPEPDDGAKSSRAAARDVRPLDHSAQRASADLSLGFALVPDRRPRNGQHPRRRRNFRRGVSPDRVPDRGRPDGVRVVPLLAHPDRDRVESDVGRFRDGRNSWGYGLATPMELRSRSPSP